ncbi:MAG: antibiotic biosynthesis monooxygenase [Pseudomonadales bacterium]|nr:antibiotic biosynthesis monooxygenase [Pseudomonadales bacterium]
MYIAMNRFKIALGKEQVFIDIWNQRETFLDEVPGFTSFNLLQGEVTEEYALFASHTVWESLQHFKDWTTSEAFKKAHAGARGNNDIYVGPPKLEGFTSVL